MSSFLSLWVHRLDTEAFQSLTYASENVIAHLEQLELRESKMLLGLP